MDNKKNGIPKLRFPEFTGAWEQRKLSSMTQYKNGKGHEDKQTDSGDFELVNLNSISIDGGFKHSGKFINESDDGILYKNDLVMILSDVGHGDLLGRVALIPDDNKFILNQRVALLRPNKTVNPEFLFFYINSHQKYFKSQGAGMSQLNISKKSVETFSSLVPNIDEQKKISLFLMKLDSLIALHQRKLEHLQEQKKGLLQKMFPKNGETVPEVRFPGFTDAWEQRKLGEVADVIDPHPSHRAPAEVKIGIPFIGISDVNEIGEINYSTVRVVDEDIYEEHHRRYDLSIPSLGIGRVASLGKVIRLRNDIGKYAISPTMSVLQPDTRIEINYLYSYMNSSQFQKQFSAKSNGSTRQSVGIKDLRTLVVSVPSSSNEQQKIGEYFSKFDSLIALHQRKLEHLELMKKGLLQQMFV